MAGAHVYSKKDLLEMKSEKLKEIEEIMHKVSTKKMRVNRVQNSHRGIRRMYKNLLIVTTFEA